MLRSHRPGAAGAAIAFAFGATLSAEPVDDPIRVAAARTYVHGITREIAEREAGAAAVPALLDLLDDPSFERNDNVVAFLAHLGGPETTPRLVASHRRSL